MSDPPSRNTDAAPDTARSMPPLPTAPRLPQSGDLRALQDAVDALTDLPRQLKRYTDALQAQQRHQHQQWLRRHEEASAGQAARRLRRDLPNGTRVAQAGRVRVRLDREARLEVQIAPGALSGSRLTALEHDLRRAVGEIVGRPPRPGEALLGEPPLSEPPLDGAASAEQRALLDSVARPLVAALDGVGGTGRDSNGWVEVRIGGGERMRLTLSPGARRAPSAQALATAVEKAWSGAADTYSVAAQTAIDEWAASAPPSTTFRTSSEEPHHG